MRARRVAILLVATALSALALFFVLLADNEALGAESGSEDRLAIETRQGPGSEDTLKFWWKWGRLAVVTSGCVLTPGPPAISQTCPARCLCAGLAWRQLSRKADDCASIQIK